MNKFEKAVKIIIKDLDLKNTIEEDYSGRKINNWGEMLEAFEINSDNMKNEIRYTLRYYENKNHETLILTDDLEIEDEDTGIIYSYRQLTDAIIKELYK